MAAGFDCGAGGLGDWRELSFIWGDISEDDCRLLVDEFGKPGSDLADVAQLVYEELESSQLTSVAELVSAIKENGFSNGRNGPFLEKKPAGVSGQKQPPDWGTAIPVSLPPTTTVHPVVVNFGGGAGTALPPLSSFQHQFEQSSWKEPPPVSPNSPRRLCDYIPDLKGASGKGHRSKKAGKKNGFGSSTSSIPSAWAEPVRAPFQDPADAAFGRLEEYFPTVPKEQLMNVFNTNDGDLDACAVELIEKNFKMEDKNAYDRPRTPTEEPSNATAVGSADAADDDMAMTTCDSEAEAVEEEPEPEMFNLALPEPFARLLLRHFGHSEDEHRELNMDQLAVKIETDVAFEIYKGLYMNMHLADAGVTVGSTPPGTSEEQEESSSSGSSSPSSSSGGAEDEFDAIAISLIQMDLETSSGDPQLSAIIDIESKLQQQKQEVLKAYSAPSRTMAQNVGFSMLKQDYPLLDPRIVDEVYSQCLLNGTKAKAALNEMYPHQSPPEQSNQNSSSTDPAWKLKYNPKEVQMYSSADLESMQMTCEEKEQLWSSKMAKFRDYHEKCKTTSDPQIKAHYLTEAKRLSNEMKELADQMQYYKAIRLNAEHKNDTVLDLHGLTVTGAIRMLKDFLQCKEDEFVSSQAPKMILLIITGQGKHSKNGTPVLQPAVGNYLTQKSYRYHAGKPGAYTVILSRGSGSPQRSRTFLGE